MGDQKMTVLKQARALAKAHYGEVKTQGIEYAFKTEHGDIMTLSTLGVQREFSLGFNPYDKNDYMSAYEMAMKPTLSFFIERNTKRQRDFLQEVKEAKNVFFLPIRDSGIGIPSTFHGTLLSADDKQKLISLMEKRLKGFEKRLTTYYSRFAHKIEVSIYSTKESPCNK